MHSNRTTSSRRHRPRRVDGTPTDHVRRGLAPLEFVAALPFIIFLASLMVVVGGAGLVKSRAQINARYAAWRSGSIRTASDPNPHNWRSPAVLLSEGGADITDAAPLWDLGSLTEPAVRGPAIGAASVPAVLDIGGQVHAGVAQYRQPLPLLRRITSKDSYDVDLMQEVMHDAWEFHSPPFSLGGNQAPRARTWYEFQQDSILPVMDGAKANLLAQPWRFDLDPLDHDPDLGTFRNFHPRFPPSNWQGSVGATRSSLAFKGPSGFLDQIRRVPGRLGQALIGHYQSQKNDWQDRLDAALNAVPQDPATITAARDAIDALDAKLGPLQAYMDALPNTNK